jgi:hypothetical protein
VTDPPLFVGLLVEGAILAVPLIVIAFLLSRFTRDIVGRSLLAIVLFAAAGAYFGFALLARDLQSISGLWVLGELAQVIVFGTMALLGLRGSPWWLVAGWALHPLWDVVLHYFGPGHSFAPVTYTIPCLSFDLLVAVYIAVAYGLIGDRRLGFRETVP